jgi:hypothetical protein
MYEYKAFPAHELKLSDVGAVEVAFAQLNVIDHDRDVTLPGAFPTKEVPMSAYGHTSWEGALPVGKGTISEEGDWAVFRGQLFMDTTHGRDAFHTLKGLGSLAEFSYGYSVLDSAPGQKDGQNVRYLKSLDPFEVSNVLKGAGVGTHLRAIKSGSPGTEMPYAEHASWIREVNAAFLDRAESRAEWRAKEGRMFSAANLEALAQVREGMVSMAEAIAALLDMAAPKDSKSDVTLEVLLGIARRLGVKT